MLARMLLPLLILTSTVKSQEEILSKHRIKTDTPSLIAFLRQRSLTEEDQRQVEQQIRQLAHDEFETREKAEKALIQRGPIVIKLLDRAKASGDLEVRRRARRCIRKINRDSRQFLSHAVVQILRQRHVVEAVPTLLLYLPFAENVETIHEILATLLALCRDRSKKKLESQSIRLILQAAKDRDAARRAAAGHVLSHLKLDEHREIILKLLTDDSPLTRFRTARGLILVGDRAGAVPLIQLLKDAPASLAWRVEDLLFRLAGKNTPEISLAGDTIAERRLWHEAWSRWWAKHEKEIDLAAIHKSIGYLGRTLIPLMHSHELYECNRQGKVLWRMTGLPKPRDAQVLPGGRVLIAEASSHQVTERDLKGKILWKHPARNASFCYRLRNGHTMVGMSKKVVVVTREGKEVFSYSPESSFYIHGMDRMRNGHIILVSMSGVLRQVDRAGKVVFSLKLQRSTGSNWCGVSEMPNGRFLVVSISPGRVTEVDRRGKIYWRYNWKGASYALALPNGNILIASHGQKMIREVTKARTVVRELKTVSTPWRIHHR